MSDEYTDWDASYVLGSLSATERREFERHLGTCDDCTAAVAELAGMPGLLLKVSKEEAVTLETTPVIPLPPTLLPRLVRSARRRQRRVRGLIAGGIVATAVAAAAVVLIVSGVVGGAIAPGGVTPSAENARLVSLSQVVPNPLSASIRLTPEGWGTRIEMNCHYAQLDAGGSTPYVPPAGSSVGYAMFVTDASGMSTQVATWTAGPGSDVEPSGTTSLAVADITRIDVRSTSTGTVLLAGRP